MSEESKTKAVSVAAAVLNYKNRSSRMLYEKLLEKGIEPDDAEYAIERLRGFGYLNDSEYAASAVRYGVSKGWGKIRIRRKLSEYKPVLVGLIISQSLLDNLFIKLVF